MWSMFEDLESGHVLEIKIRIGKMKGNTQFSALLNKVPRERWCLRGSLVGGHAELCLLTPLQSCLRDKIQ